MSSAFYGPMIAMVALTMAVWVESLRRRVREVSQRRIPLQSLAHARDAAAAFQDCRAMDNFNNLLQMPVLFYVACLVLAQTGTVGLPWLAGAWSYVLLRGVHSAIQVGANRVRHRFYAWLASGLVLFGMWAGIAAQWLTHR